MAGSVVSNPDSGLLAELARRLDEEIRSALDGAVRFAGELSQPQHPPVTRPSGSVPWHHCARLRVRIRYRCAWCTYDLQAMRKAHPDGPILINGGGNFGDLYKGQQGLRERLLREVKDRPIIQRPQSIHFQKQANLARVCRD